MPTPTAVTTSPTSRLLAAKPWVRDTPLEGSTVGDLVPKQVRLGIRGSGPLSQREIRPETEAAAALMASPAWAGTEKTIRGALSTLDGRAGRASIGGLSFTTDKAGLLASAITSAGLTGYIDPGTRPNANWKQKTDEIQSELAPALDQPGAAVSLYMTGPKGEGKIEMAPAFTNLFTGKQPDPNDFMAALMKPSLDYAAALSVTHEAEHSVSRPSKSAMTGEGPAYGKFMGVPVNWVEEGLAQTMTMMPGKLDRMADKLGIKIDPAVSSAYQAHLPYGDFRSTVDGLLRIGNLNPDDTAHEQQIDKVLQAKSTRFVPGQLADAIIQARGLAPEKREALRQKILNTHGEPAKLAAVEKWVDSLATRPRTAPAPAPTAPSGPVVTFDPSSFQ